MAPRLAALPALLLVGACTKDPPPPPPSPPLTATMAATAAPTVTASATATATADVVAHASTPYDPGPSVLASGGSVDGAALRKRHVERLKADTSPVTVLKGEGPLDLGKRICEAVVPRRPPATPVLLKPNLCGFDSIKDPEKWKCDDGVHGRGTDVDFTRGVVRCLKARGHTAITIAEGCGISHKHWLNVAHVTGYDAMAQEEGVKLVALDDDGVFDVEGDQPGKPLPISGIGSSHVPTLLVAKVLAEHLDRGLFLSLPKLKAHRYAVVSIGIKGMQGVVMLSDKAPAYKQKWRMHRELNHYLDLRAGKDDDGAPVPKEENRQLYVASLMAFAERMADVLEIETPDAVLAEGAPAMGGDGFQALRPSNERVAIGGTNPVLVDRVGAAFLGLWDRAELGRELAGHRTSPLIEVAAKRFKLDLSAPGLAGDGASLLAAPRPVHFKAMAPFSIDWDPPGVEPVGVFTFPAAGATTAGNAGSTGWNAGREAGDRSAGREAGDPSTGTGTGAGTGTGPSANASTGTPSPFVPASHDRRGREVHAAALGEEVIALDGKGDEAAWGRAPAVTWDTDYAGTPTGISTKVRMLWGKAGLHVLFELSGAGFHTDASRPVEMERKGLYEEDCVEVFLSPDAGRPKRYFEVEMGPFGHFLDVDVDRERGKQNTAWSSLPRIATKRDPKAHTATIEALLGAPEIVAALVPGARLPVALYRIEGLPERHYLAWSPPRTAKPDFHVPEAFGTLAVDPP